MIDWTDVLKKFKERAEGVKEIYYNSLLQDRVQVLNTYCMSILNYYPKVEMFPPKLLKEFKMAINASLGPRGRRVGWL